MNNQMVKEVEEKVLNIISQHSSKNEINKDDNFSDLGINSVDFIKIIVGIESEFDFEFYDDDLVINRFKTIQELIDYNVQRIQEK